MLLATLLTSVVGNPYRLKAHLQDLQHSRQSALEAEASEIWELSSWDPWGPSCCLSLASRSFGRNKESLSKDFMCLAALHTISHLFSFLSCCMKTVFPTGKCGVGKTGHLVCNSSPSLKPFCRLCCMILYFIL